MLPPRSQIRALLEEFFTVARQSMSVVKAGSLANAGRTNDAKKGLSAFVQQLTAFGQEDGATSEVYDLTAAQTFVTDMRLKIDSLSAGMIDNSQAKLQRSISTTLELLRTTNRAFAHQ